MKIKDLAKETGIGAKKLEYYARTKALTPVNSKEDAEYDDNAIEEAYRAFFLESAGMPLTREYIDWAMTFPVDGLDVEKINTLKGNIVSYESQMRKIQANMDKAKSELQQYLQQIQELGA